MRQTFFMAHALIIDDNRIISRAIEDCLTPLGFDSFDHTWTEAQAVSVAESRPPDLVVIGDAVSGGSPAGTAHHIAEKSLAPILLVRAGQCEVLRRMPDGVTLDGPFLLSDFDNVVAVARKSPATGPSHHVCEHRGDLAIPDVPTARAA